MGVPWDWKKQICGDTLEIIGHFVDTNDMYCYLEAFENAFLVSDLQTFTTQYQHQLVDWQYITGWAS